MGRINQGRQWSGVVRRLCQRPLHGLLKGSCMVSLIVLAASCSAVESPSTSSTPETLSPAVEDPQPTAPDSPSSPTMPSQAGQQLPITAMATIGAQEILLEVAATPRQQALGLMFRDPLPDQRGMLFPMGRPRPVSFWMKNVPVPLDMVFIYDGTVQHIAADVPPCAADPCPTYGPGGQLVDAVIELRGGHAAELGLEIGDRVVISPVDSDSTQAE